MPQPDQSHQFSLLSIMTLTKGNHYDLTTLTHTGWTTGDGTGAEGYNFSDYFDWLDRYQGPDQHGIEPEFEDDEEIAQIKTIPGVIDAKWTTSPAADGPTIMVQCGPEVDLTKLPGGVIDGSTTDEDGCFDVVITLARRTVESED